MEQVEYDILGRIIHSVEPVTGTVYDYEYNDLSSRIVTITNETNRSNFKTIKKQKLINEEYIDSEIKEFGDTYNILKIHNEKNNEVYYERTNLKTGKIFKKKSVWKENKLQLWATEYDGTQKDVGFRMSKNILTGITNNF